MNSATMLLQDFIDAPSKAETILDSLTTEQVQLIEATINSVKKRKLNKSVTPCDTQESANGVTIDCNANPTTTGTPSAGHSSSLALAIANVLATAMANAVANSIQEQQQPRRQQQQQQQQQQQTWKDKYEDASTKQQHGKLSTMAEIKDGVEWVSFAYSHNRVMKNYTVRTDLDTIQLDDIDDKFKTENCVYPRANLPKDQYKGNRWSYETECNVLGWKLAWLNQSEISGKRGLIQRAVDSYRNRYPSMRSRRMARQAKLQNGTLRKRKQPQDEDEQQLQQHKEKKKAGLMDLMTCLTSSTSSTPYVTPITLDAATIKPANQPKTIAMEDLATGSRCRIKIHVETVSLDYIPHDFRLANSPFPRHLVHPSGTAAGRPRFIEETICNELSWKLAWLNPKLLAGKKNMLQRAVDLFRSKFMPSMPPRKHSSRRPTVYSSSSLTSPPPRQLLTTQLIPNTENDQQETSTIGTNSNISSPPPAYSLSPTMSCMSGTTASLDFSDCLSLADETMDLAPNISKSNEIMLSVSPLLYAPPPPPLPCFDEASASSSVTCSPSPPSSELFGMMTMDEMYDALMLPPTVSVDDTFMFADLDPTTTTATTAIHHKLFEPSSSSSSSSSLFLSSPSLPSSTLQQDVLVKMESVDDFTCQLLESFL